MSAAIAAGVVREVFTTAAAAERHGALLAELPSATPVHEVDDDAAAALSETVTPQGLVAVADLPRVGLAEALSAPPSVPGHRLVVVLVEARDPGNAGTVVRTADAAGADCVIFAGDSVDPWSGKCVRASAGSLLHLPDRRRRELGRDRPRAEARRAARSSRRTGMPTPDLHGPTAQQALAGDHAWVFGNEAHGLSRSHVRSADISLRVPVYGRAESLNLAAAAAVCIYESARAARQEPSARSLTEGSAAEEVRG